MSKITLAIATYNRLPYVERMLASLKASVDISRLNIRIYDDHSDTLSREDLERIFPFAKEIIIREKNLGADGNMRAIYDDFLKTEDEILIHADSDLIYRPGWLDVLEQLLPQTDGILSLYNSRCHPFSKMINAQYGDKEHLGAAGVAFRREIVELIVNNIPPNITHSADWLWMSLLRKENIRLICLTESYIQHIGILGQNNRGYFLDFDYGLNFLPENEINQRIMMQFLDETFIENKKFIFRKQNEEYKFYKKRQWDYLIGHLILALPRELLRVIKRIKNRLIHGKQY